MTRRLLAALALLAQAMVLFGQPSEAETRKKIVEVAFKYRGVPYVYGAESPQAFDCSGFVRYVYRQAYGIELPRSARGFYTAGSPVAATAAKAGDIFVFDTVGGAPSHVAIYLGDGTVIHAVSEGPKTGVIVSPMTDRYWAPRLLAARTFIASATASPPSGHPSGSTTTAAPPAGGKPAATGAVVSADTAIVDIGFVIPAVKASYTDKIPTAAGTSLAFTLTNGTGATGSFIVLFFRINPKSYKLEQIHEEKVRLAEKASMSLPAYRFDEPGKYRLVVKDSWGNQLLDRSFVVETIRD